MTTLDYFSLGHPFARVRSRYALRARTRMFEQFMHNVAPTAAETVLDLGVTPDHSLEESNFFEALYPWPQRITAASIEDARHLERRHPGVRFVHLAPGRLPFSDGEFDVVFCSAVLEHVGEREAQRAFVREALRVGRRFFFTTPNRWFPLEFHTLLPLLHWLPQPLHQGALRRVGHDFLARTENLNLLDEAALRGLFAGSAAELSIRRVRLFGMTSNLVAFGCSAGGRNAP
jgi:SAM-dependent methyltransferase